MEAGRGQSFWRSFAVLGSFQPAGMQNLGFLQALYPLLRGIYRDEPDRLAPAMLRHLEPYNCHPYFSGVFLGLCANLEQRVARGEISADEAARVKNSLAGPLAAIGDGFFWMALKPAALALAAAVAFTGFPIAAVLLFIFVYNVPHLLLRVWGLRAGFAGGDEIVATLGRWRLPAWGDRLKDAANVLLGAAAVFMAANASPVVLAPGTALFAAFGCGALLALWPRLNLSGVRFAYYCALMCIAGGYLS